MQTKRTTTRRMKRAVNGGGRQNRRWQDIKRSLFVHERQAYSCEKQVNRAKVTSPRPLSKAQAFSIDSHRSVTNVLEPILEAGEDLALSGLRT